MKKILAALLIITLLLSVCACGPSEEKYVDLTLLYADFQKTLPEMMLLNEDTMLNFLGIDTEDCAQVIVALCENGLKTDEIWLIQAKDSDAMDRLTAMANSRITAKKDETLNYSPEQFAVVEKAVIINQGLYLAVIVSPDVDTLKSAFEAAFK